MKSFSMWWQGLRNWPSQRSTHTPLDPCHQVDPEIQKAKESMMHEGFATRFQPDKNQLEQCHSYIDAQIQLKQNGGPRESARPPGPAIAISHQTGSGAHEIAAMLPGLLQTEEPKETVPWTVFDRHLLEKVIKDKHLPHALVAFLPEDRRSYLQDAIDEMFGMIPPSWEIVPAFTETIIHLADAGHVILVGRGANFITARMPNVLHIHLVAPLEKRIERMQRLEHLSAEEAAKVITKEDRARGRYMKANFHVGIDDDLLYHLVINTDLIPCPNAARLIAELALRMLQDHAGG
jgi:hypothetical protein